MDFNILSRIQFQIKQIWCKIKSIEVSQGIQSIIAGTNVTVDNTDPLNPVISSTGGGGSVTDQDNIPRFVDVTLANIGYVEGDTEDQKIEKLRTWILSQNFVIGEKEIWYFQLEKNSSEENTDSLLEIPFSTEIAFENNKSISIKTLDSNINYTYNPDNAKLNSFQIHEIIPNGKTISFSDDFFVKGIEDVDLSLAIEVIFHKTLTPNLKPIVFLTNIEEPVSTAPRYKVNPVGGTAINTWFDWFEFTEHIVDSDDCVYNIGLFPYEGQTYILGNFTNVGQGESVRWAYFSLLESEWETGKIIEPDGLNTEGVRVKLGSVKPNTLIQANTSNYTLVQI